MMNIDICLISDDNEPIIMIMNGNDLIMKLDMFLTLSVHTRWCSSSLAKLVQLTPTSPSLWQIERASFHVFVSTNKHKLQFHLIFW